MPSYDFTCERCGPFVARRPMALFDQPVPCPGCGLQSVRALTVPASSELRRRATLHQDESGYRRLAHRAGCACCSG